MRLGKHAIGRVLLATLDAESAEFVHRLRR
jgi:hypothetical protein